MNVNEPLTVNAPHLCAVVIVYNQCEQTLACLQALSGVTYPAWTILLVDNGSTDGTAKTVAQAFPQVHVLRLYKNCGYAEGTNSGVRWALAEGADYVLLLNNDIWIAPDAPGALVAAAEADSTIAVVGPKVYYADEPQRLQSAGGIMDWRRVYGQLIGEGEIDHGQYERPCDVDFVVGCAMLIQAQAWHVVGEFDPAFFLYYEDVDWCLRASRAGFRVLYFPWAAVWHANRGTARIEPELVTYYTVRNRLILAQRYANRISQGAIYLDELWRAGRALRLLITARRRAQAIATLQAVRDFFGNQLGPGPYPTRTQSNLRNHV